MNILFDKSLIVQNTKGEMLNKFGIFWYAIRTFQGVPSHQYHQNRKTGTAIECNTFRSLSVLSVL